MSPIIFSTPFLRPGQADEYTIPAMRGSNVKSDGDNNKFELKELEDADIAVKDDDGNVVDHIKGSRSRF